MLSSDTLPKPEKYPHEKLRLDGSNYFQWATEFKAWAGDLGLWPYINGDEQEPSPPTQLSESDPDRNIIRKEAHDVEAKKFKQRRLVALSALSTAIDIQDFVYLRDTDDPHTGWTSLANKHLPQKAIRFNQYLGRLFSIPKAHDSASISHTFQLLVALKAELTALATSASQSTTASASSAGASTSPSTGSNEYSIPDVIFVHVLLHALPDYYDTFRRTLVNSTASLDFNDVINCLKTQELHRTGGMEHMAMPSGHRGTNINAPTSIAGRVAPKGFDEAKGDSWVTGWRPKCGHCLNVGHIWMQCRARLSQNDKAPKSASTPPSPASTNTDTSTAGTTDDVM